MWLWPLHLKKAKQLCDIQILSITELLFFMTIHLFYDSPCIYGSRLIYFISQGRSFVPLHLFSYSRRILRPQMILPASA